MAKRHKNIEELFENGKELIAFYREHPCTAAYELLGVDFAPIQRLVFRDMWFKNYVIATCGRGYGKSQSVDSKVLYKDKGLVYLHEELPPIPAYLRPGDDEVINWDDDVYTSEGFRNTKKLCLEKRVGGKKVITQNGFENMGSNHHPLLILNQECEFDYKNLDELLPGDRVCIQRGQNVFGSSSIPIDDAYLIGLFIGDGCIGSKGVLPSITSEDEVIKDFCINYCIDNNLEYRKDDDVRTKNTSKIYFKSFRSFFKKYGIGEVLSYDKSVPYSVRTSTRESQIAFLQGYFDADGTAEIRTGGVSCCSVSKKLLQEIQLMLLNFGIVARLRKKKTKSKFGKAYLLDMFSEDAYKFSELIGFGLKRKQCVLDHYFESKTLNVNKDTIPYVKALCRSIRKSFLKNNCKKYNDPIGKMLPFKSTNKKEITYKVLYDFLANLINVENLGYSLDSYQVDKLNDVLKYNYYYDTVVSVEDWEGDCYDFEMDMEKNIEPNYFSNGFINHNTFALGVLAALSALLYPGNRIGLIGPVFRQSKMIFHEVEKLYDQSSILREACVKRPTRGSDTCFLKFKSVGGKTPSFIEALPLGDGTKIRGSRFYVILVDELAQVPDQILDMVLRPMGATSLAPMEKVRRLEEQERLIKAGLATEADFAEEKVNKMVMTSSGYYKFNHMWRRMRDHWKMMNEAEAKGKECDYVVWQVPYWDLPKGFLDMNNINEAKRIMSNSEFRMEYEGAMVDDSEGFFKASLLEDCTLGSGFGLNLTGGTGNFIMGVDPNQGGADSCGVVILELGSENKIVNVIELKKQTTQVLTKTVQSLCEQYNIIRIYMDKGGGGKAIMDLLEDGYDNKEPILDRTNPDNDFKDGRHILEMVTFNPAWISDANFTTKSLFEAKHLLFPELSAGAPDVMDKAYDCIRTLKSQLLSIIVTQTATGILHFDTPSKSMHKDLYSALILAAHGARMFEKEMEEDTAPILHNSSGMVRLRGVGSTNFTPFSVTIPASNPSITGFSNGNSILGGAVLQKRLKKK